MIWVAVVVVTALFASADDAGQRINMTDVSGMCPAERARLDKSMKELEAGKVEFSGNDSKLCDAVVKEMGRCCNKPDFDCGVRPLTMKTEKGKGINGNFDQMADGAVKTSNLAHSARLACQGTNPSAAKKAGIPQSGNCLLSIKDKKKQKLGINVMMDQRSLMECLQKERTKYEDMAKDILAKKGFSDSLDCTTSGFCVYKDAGETITKLDPQEAEATPARMSPADPDGQSCSGTVVGKQTVVSASHCEYGDNVKIEVPDEKGVMRTVTGSCKGPAYEEMQQDFAICSLSEPVQARPTYIATLDRSLTGTECVPVDYVLRCPAGAFSAANGQPVATSAYPGGKFYDDGMRSTGQMQTLITEDRALVLHNNYTYKGSSGGGVITQINGYNAIVAPVSVGPTYDPLLGVAPIIHYNDIKGYKIQSLSAQQVQGLSPTVLQVGAVP